MSLPRTVDRPIWQTVVIGPEQIAMASDADCRIYTRPAGLLLDPEHFLTFSHSTMGTPAECVVVVDEWPFSGGQLASLGPWQHRSTVAGSAWSTFVHDITGEAIQLVCLKTLAARDPSSWLLEHDVAPLAVKLSQYHRLTNTVYRATPGVSGCTMVRQMHAAAAARKAEARKGTAGQPFWRYEQMPSDLSPMGDLKWQTDEMPAAGYVTQWDVRAAYLAAASAALLAWSPLRHTGPRQFDPAVAGFWQVFADGTLLSLHGGRPFVIDPRQIGPGGMVWLSSPVMAYLLSLGISPEVADSWTCDQAGRYLRPWAEAIRDGLAADDIDPDVAYLLKQTYRETLGMMNRPGGSIHRPDWWATVVDLARVNLLRKMDKAAKATGLEPIRVYVDAVSYVTDNGGQLANLADALGVDEQQIGKLRANGGMTAEAWAAKHARRPKVTRRNRATATAGSDQ